MNFGSLEYILFFLAVFSLYVNINSNRIKICLIAVSSVIFYSFWNWKFTFLLMASSILDYSIGIGFLKFKTDFSRKLLISLSLLGNLGVLIFFKYSAFFAYEIVRIEKNLFIDSIVLPVGISFFTFQTMSYTIDVYNGKLKTERNFIHFFAYVSMFPQLVAGPIVRASSLLPQLRMLPQRLDNRDQKEAITRVLLGFVKKLVLADNLAPIANQYFQNHDIDVTLNPMFGVMAFMLQIYLDFSAYSDIAIGTARLFGLKFEENFNYPYHAKNISDFWKRWHISLTSWFRDYLFIPLGGSRAGHFKTIRNIFIVFLVSGIWHGAGWNFIIWGLLHFTLYLPYVFKRQNPSLLSFFRIKSVYISRILFLLLIMVTWIPFRAESVESSVMILSDILSYRRLISIQNLADLLVLMVSLLYVSIEPVIDIQLRRLSWNDRYYIFATNTLVLMIVLFMSRNESDFIYFQF